MANENPLPLVTATFTTDELAKCAAGLNLLRKEWARRGMEGSEEALTIVQETTDLLNRIAGLVTEEQGAALIGSLLRDLRNRHE